MCSLLRGKFLFRELCSVPVNEHINLVCLKLLIISHFRPTLLYFRNEKIITLGVQFQMYSALRWIVLKSS